MKLLKTLMLLLCFSNAIKAQVYLRDIQGRVIRETNFVGVIGSPFENDEFLVGNVILTNENEYENVPLKYDIYNDALYFKNTKDETMLSFVVPVKWFKIAGQTYLNGYPNIDNYSKNTFYGLVAGNKIKLLFKVYKTISESTPYNSPNVEKKFERYKDYYILKKDKMYKFKPSKKDIINLFVVDAPKINEYIKQEKINFKKEEDLVKVIDFINLL